MLNGVNKRLSWKGSNNLSYVSLQYLEVLEIFNEVQITTFSFLFICHWSCLTRCAGTWTLRSNGITFTRHTICLVNRLISSSRTEIWNISLIARMYKTTEKLLLSFKSIVSEKSFSSCLNWYSADPVGWILLITSCSQNQQ